VAGGRFAAEPQPPLWLEVPFGKLGEQGKANKPIKKEKFRRN